MFEVLVFRQVGKDAPVSCFVELISLDHIHVLSRSLHETLRPISEYIQNT